MPAYFIAVLITFIVWITLFLSSKHIRKEMLIVGGLLTPFAILDALTTPSYWKPVTAFNLPVGIEGFMFTFFITGIAAVVYEIIFKKRYKANKIQVSDSIAFIIPIAISLFSVYFLNLNIIYLFILGFTLMAASELVSRRDLLINSISSSVLFGVIYAASFLAWLTISPESISWWNTDNISGIKLGMIPLEEVLFSLSLGLFAGPLYEYLTDAKLSLSHSNTSK